MIVINNKQLIKFNINSNGFDFETRISQNYINTKVSRIIKSKYFPVLIDILKLSSQSTSINFNGYLFLKTQVY